MFPVYHPEVLRQFLIFGETKTVCKILSNLHKELKLLKIEPNKAPGEKNGNNNHNGSSIRVNKITIIKITNRSFLSCSGFRWKNF